MSDFDVSRIVPSTRDLLGAIHTRRKGLALVPHVEGDDEEAVAHEVARLDGLDVRAFALSDAGPLARAAATSTDATPSLCLAEATSAEDCQRARFYGADGVGVRFGEEPPLEKMAQSMRMMALGHATSIDDARAAVDAGARAVLFVGSVDDALAVGETIGPPVLVVAHVVPGVDRDSLRKLDGIVDAAVVPATLHRADDFEALLEELDS